MPELPEVEIVKQSLVRNIHQKKIKKVIIKNRNLRFKIPKKFEELLKNKIIKKITRFSKYIILNFFDGSFCLIHLGMSGTIHLIKKKSANFTIKKKKINKFIAEEIKFKIFSKSTFKKFQKSIDFNKEEFINLLIKLKLQNKKVVAYGAPAKGNTFLNFCSIDQNLIDFTVDRADTKIGKFLPGSMIPIFHPEKLNSYMPDYIIILPWNLKKEIIYQLKKRGLKSKFITCIPNLKISN